MLSRSSLAILLLVIGVLSIGIGAGKYFGSAQTSIPATSSTPAPTPNTDQQNGSVIVPAKKMWVDAHVQLVPGSEVALVASGQVNACPDSTDAAYKWVGPTGWGHQPEFWYGPRDLPTALRNKSQYEPVLGLNSSFMCLTAKIGRNGQPFYIGDQLRFTADRSGTLYLGVNEAVKDQDGNPITDSHSWWTENLGEFQVKVFKLR